MPVTTYRNWSYPLRGLKPYYIEITGLYDQIDFDVNSLYSRLDNITINDILPVGSKGDIFIHNGSDYTRVPVGTDGQVLTADSSSTTGASWEATPTANYWSRSSSSLSPTVTTDGLSINAVGVNINLATDSTINFTDGISGPHTLQDLLNSSDIIIAGTGTLSAVRAGTTNTVSGDYSFAVGQGNIIASTYSIAGGLTNTISNGANNLIVGTLSTYSLANSSVLSGTNNGNASLSMQYSLVAGRYINTTPVGGSVYCSIVGGNTNNVVGDENIVCGELNSGTLYEGLITGYNNTLSGILNTRSLIAGHHNVLTAVDSSVVIGDLNTATTIENSIISGDHNTLTSLTHSTVSGELNTVTGNHLIVGGKSNTVGAGGVSYSLVIGYNNPVRCAYASIIFGTGNTNYATGNQVATSIVGGSSNVVPKNNSLNDSVLVGYHNNFCGGRGVCLIGGGMDSWNSTTGSTTTGLGYSWYSAFFGSSHKVGSDNSYMLVSGYGHKLSNNTRYSSITGQDHTINSSSCAYLTISGSQHTIYDSGYLSGLTVAGERNKISTAGNQSSTVFGKLNELGLRNTGTSISFSITGSTVTLIDTDGLFPTGLASGTSVKITIAGATSAGNDGSFVLTYVDANTVTYTNASGVTEAGIATTSWYLEVEPDTGTESFNTISGAYNKVYAGGSNVALGYGNEIIGSPFSSAIGYANKLYPGSTYSSVVGYDNTLNVGSRFSLVSGYQNEIASLFSLISGQANVITGSPSHILVGGNANTIEGGTSGSIVHGYLNILGSGSSYASIFGNSINLGGGCSYNLATGSNHSIAYGGGGSSYNAVSGQANILYNSCSNNNVSGYSNILGTAGTGASYNLISGGTNKVDGAYNAVAGNSNILSSQGPTLSHNTVTCMSNIISSYNTAQYNNIFGLSNRVAGGSSNTIGGSYNNIRPFNIGTTISLSAPSGSTVTLTDTRGGFTSSMTGSTFIISGAVDPNNDGSFSITYVSSTQITFTNASGSAESSNTSLQWLISGSGTDNVTIFGSLNSSWNAGGANGLIVGTLNSVKDGTASNSIIGGSLNSTASGAGANSLIIGYSNTANSGAGANSIISGTNNTITSGASNIVMYGTYNSTGSSNYSIVGGNRAYAYFNYAQFVSGGHPDGSSTTTGQGQIINNIPHSSETSNATPTRLYLAGGTSGDFTTISGNAMTIVTYVIAKCTAGDSVTGTRSWKIETLINNVAGTLSVVGYNITIIGSTSVSHEVDWTVIPAVYSTNVFSFTVTGHASDTIRWQCYSAGPEIGIS